MKNLKKKLVAAVAMLVVSALALTGASFAWYTLSTNPEISDIKANVAANENLEIALDNNYANETAVDTASQVSTGVQGSDPGDWYTWGNWVDLTTAMNTLNPSSSSKGSPKLDLKAVSYDDSKLTAGTTVYSTTLINSLLKYPRYELDGRLKDVTQTLTATVIDDLTRTGTEAAAAGGVQGLKQGADSTGYDAFAVTYWIRSNEDTEVLLCDAKARAGSDGAEADYGSATAVPTTDVNGAMGAGSYLWVKVDGENVDMDAYNKLSEADKADETKANAAKYGRVLDYAKNIVVRFDIFESSTKTENAYKYEKSLWGKYDSTVTIVNDDNGTDTDATDDFVWLKFKIDFADGKNTSATAKTAVTQGTTLGTRSGKVNFTLNKNEAKEVQMVVYYDGLTTENSDALLDNAELKLNIQFSSYEIDGSGETPGSLNGTTNHE